MLSLVSVHVAVQTWWKVKRATQTQTLMCTHVQTHAHPNTYRAPARRGCWPKRRVESFRDRQPGHVRWGTWRPWLTCNLCPAWHGAQLSDANTRTHTRAFLYTHGAAAGTEPCCTEYKILPSYRVIFWIQRLDRLFFLKVRPEFVKKKNVIRKQWEHFVTELTHQFCVCVC